MIEVLTVTAKTAIIDRAEAETPEAAIYAARVMLDESYGGTTLDKGRRALFLVDGVLVRDVIETDLWRATL